MEEPDDPVHTLASEGSAVIEVLGSEFIAVAAPAATIDEATSYIEHQAADHSTASHVVSAWRVIDSDGLLRNQFDNNGEPSGTAGKPILTVLTQRNLINSVVVIIRYFGGTELGTGRLSRAYSRTATAAIDAAGVIDHVPTNQLGFTLTYDDAGTVRGILERENIDFDAEYTETVQFDVRIPTDREAWLRDRLNSITRGRVSFHQDS